MYAYLSSLIKDVQKYAVDIINEEELTGREFWYHRDRVEEMLDKPFAEIAEAMIEKPNYRFQITDVEGASAKIVDYAREVMTDEDLQEFNDAEFEPRQYVLEWLERHQPSIDLSKFCSWNGVSDEEMAEKINIAVERWSLESGL